MKRLPLIIAGLAMLALLATACGGAAPTATPAPVPASGSEEVIQDQQTAAEPQLLYFYADW